MGLGLITSTKRPRLDELPSSDTCDLLLRAIGLGCPISLAADISRGIVSEIPDVPEALYNFASLGSWGKHPSNEERDLHNWCRNLYNCQLEVYHLKLDLHMPDMVDPVEVQIPVLIPFEVMRSLYLQGSPQFTVSILGDRGQAGLDMFWENALRERWAQLHPTVLAGHTPGNLIPITWHMDGAEVHRNSEFYFYSFGSLLAQASQSHALDCKFHCAAVPHGIMRHPGTKAKVVKLLADFTAWSLKVGGGWGITGYFMYSLSCLKHI